MDSRSVSLPDMVALSETTTIALPADAVWPLLRDPALVASCIPGATLSPDQGDGMWRGSIRVKFGPTVAVFRGEATLTFDDAQRTCTIEGRGIDGRGASRALANGAVKISGKDATELAIDGSFTVSGPVETFANAGGVHVARALLAEFSANLAKLVAERRQAEAPLAAEPIQAMSSSSSGPRASRLAHGIEETEKMSGPGGPRSNETPPPPPLPAAELNAGKLLWQALLSWLRSLARK
jgi:carbon monoxide dehydrogenase subunit G